MRPGWFNGVSQAMVFPETYHDLELRGKPKGLRVVLEERGLWPVEGLKARCPSKCKIGASTCCATKIMSLQEDFSSQRCLIQETIEAAGHKCIFYPKFHCEFNYIEYFWGAAKHYTRRHCDYSWAGLKKTVPVALSSVQLRTIRRYAQRSQRYMNAYRIGLSYKDAEHAVKKLKSHRRAPSSL